MIRSIDALNFGRKNLTFGSKSDNYMPVKYVPQEDSFERVTAEPVYRVHKPKSLFLRPLAVAILAVTPMQKTYAENRIDGEPISTSLIEKNSLKSVVLNQITSFVVNQTQEKLSEYEPKAHLGVVPAVTNSQLINAGKLVAQAEIVKEAVSEAVDSSKPAEYTNVLISTSDKADIVNVKEYEKMFNDIQESDNVAGTMLITTDDMAASITEAQFAIDAIARVSLNKILVEMLEEKKKEYAEGSAETLDKIKRDTAVGTGVGTAGGILIGIKAGALGGSMGGPVGALGGAIIGGIIGGFAGGAGGAVIGANGEFDKVNDLQIQIAQIYNSIEQAKYGHKSTNASKECENFFMHDTLLPKIIKNVKTHPLQVMDAVAPNVLAQMAEKIYQNKTEMDIVVSILPKTREKLESTNTQVLIASIDLKKFNGLKDKSKSIGININSKQIPAEYSEVIRAYFGANNNEVMNGKMSIKEKEQFERMVNAFSVLDRKEIVDIFDINRDGHVNLRDLAIYNAQSNFLRIVEDKDLSTLANEEWNAQNLRKYVKNSADVYKYFDVNGDGEVNNTDRETIKNLERSKSQMDINKDGVIDKKDKTILKNVLYAHASIVEKARNIIKIIYMIFAPTENEAIDQLELIKEMKEREESEKQLIN